MTKGRIARYIIVFALTTVILTVAKMVLRDDVAGIFAGLCLAEGLREARLTKG